MITLGRPTDGEGDEAEYNRWYNDVHLPDLQAVAGNISARRFKIVTSNRIDLPYSAVTEFEAEDADTLMERLSQMAANSTNSTDKVDRSTSIFLIAEEIDAAA